MEPTPSPEKKTLLFPLLLILGLTLLLWFPVVFLNRSLFVGDIRACLTPVQFFHHTPQEGHRPLWNPYVFCGAPTFAHFTTLFFYPVAWISYLALEKVAALNFIFVIHFFMGGTFMFLYARSIQLSTVGSLIAALVFEFGGNSIWHATHIETTSISMYLPLLFYLFERYLRDRTTTSLLLLPVLFGLLITIGHPQSLVFISYLFFFYVLIRLLALVPNHRWHAIFWGGGLCALTIGLGTALGGFFAVPMLETLSYSERSGGTSYEFATSHSWPPINAITFFIPHFFGRILEDVLSGGTNIQEYWGQYYDSWGLFMNYVGLLPLGFALIAVFFRPHRLSLFYGLSTLIIGLLALGKYTPIYGVFYTLVPGIKYMRGPMHWWYLGSFCLAILAGMGAHLVLQIWNSTPPLITNKITDKIKKHPRNPPNPMEHQARSIIRILWGLAITTILVTIWYWWHFQSYVIDNPWQMMPPVPVHLWEREKYNLLCLGFTLGTLLLFIKIFSASRQKTHFSPAFTATLTIVIVASDLFVWFASANPTVPRDSYILSSPVARTITRSEPQPVRIYNGHQPTRDDPWNNHNPLGLSMSNFHAIEKTDGYLGIHIKAIHPQFLEILPKNRKLIDLLGVKYFVIDERIQKNPSALPRAFFIDRVTVIPNEAHRISALHQLDPAATLILEDRKALSGLTLANQGIRRDAIISNERYSPDRIIYRATTPSDGFFFISDAYYPGWSVWVDHIPTTIYRANHAFRAVPLKQGSHHIEFIFQPDSLRLGMIVSVSTAILMVGLAIIFRNHLWNFS